MFNLRKPTWYDFVQALERAGRAFVAAAIAIYPIDSIIGAPIDVDLAKKAALAGSVAAVSFLWRFFLLDVGRSKAAPNAHIPDDAATPSHLTDAEATEA